jgi:hypothetical protein
VVRDILITGAVMLLSMAILMTAMRLWTAKILGEGWLPWREWWSRHPTLALVLATPYGWIAALPIAAFIVAPAFMLPIHPRLCPVDKYASPEAFDQYDKCHSTLGTWTVGMYYARIGLPLIGLCLLVLFIRDLRRRVRLGEPGADMLKDWVGIVAGILAILSWFGLHGVHDVAHLFASDPH